MLSDDYGAPWPVPLTAGGVLGAGDSPPGSFSVKCVGAPARPGHPAGGFLGPDRHGASPGQCRPAAAQVPQRRDFQFGMGVETFRAQDR
jgi:hypothetical protein